MVLEFFAVPENTLLLVSLVLLLAQPLLRLLRVNIDSRASFYLSVSSYLILVGVFFSFVRYFLVSDLRMREVFLRSSPDAPILHRLVASWSGAGGSSLMLVFLLALSALALRIVSRRSMDQRRRAFATLDLFLAYFLVMALFTGPFFLTADAPVGGRGLSPSLQAFWTAIHPPLIFAGYVLSFLAFAFVINKLRSGDPADTRLYRVFARSSWLLLTVGIALGGAWAYGVLGWGGYWAWDPLETSALLVWLALTGFVYSKRLSSEAVVEEFMLFLTVVLIFFSMFVVKSGFLLSVHAYALTFVGPLYLTAILLTSAASLVGLRRRRLPFLPFELDFTVPGKFLHGVAFWSLFSMIIVCFSGLASGLFAGLMVGTPAPISPEYFTNWTYPFVIVFLCSVSIRGLAPSLGLRRAGFSVLAYLAVGSVMALFNMPSAVALFNLVLPLLLFALFSSVVGVATAESIRGRWMRLFETGLVLTLLGVSFSSSLVSTTGFLDAEAGAQLDLLGLETQFGDVDLTLADQSVSFDGQFVPEYSEARLSISLREGGASYEAVAEMRFYPNYGVFSRPIILSRGWEDLYLVVAPTDALYQDLVRASSSSEPLGTDSFVVSLSRFPLVSFIWVGVAFMALAICLTLVSTLRERPPETVSTPAL